jgi:type IV pilus assembly protein PilM
VVFSKPNKSIGIDIGTHSVKSVQVSKAGGRLRVDAAGYAPIDPAQMNVDPIEAQADAVRESLRFIQTAKSVMVGALPGQTVVIRYPRLPDRPPAEMAKLVEQEASQNLPYELSEVYIDWTVLEHLHDKEDSLAKVLLVAAKHELIDLRMQIAESAGIAYNILGVDSLALADAAECCDFLRVGETVAMIDIGVGSTILHFVKDGVSNFYRDLNWGARDLLQAITKSRRVDERAAEQILRDAAHAGQAPADADESGPPDLPEEPDSRPALGSGLDMLDSGLDDFDSALESLGGYNAGSGSALDPLDDEPAPLASPSIGSPSIGGSLDGGALGAADAQSDSLEEILHIPLSRLVSEVRRSFDYYEQQLYEQPVDRVILSGGVAQLPMVFNTLRDELGLEEILVADPTSSALTLGRGSALEPLRRQPAQFLVAVGLAARGAAEL